MAAKGGVQPIVILHHQAGTAFKTCIALPFFRKHRYRPALLCRQYGFKVPVSPLHQSNPDGRPSLLSPFEKIPQILLRIVQISLDCDAGIRPGTKLIFTENLPEDLQSGILEGVLLHIEVDESVALPCRSKNRAQPVPNGCAGSGRVDRIELAEKR